MSDKKQKQQKKELTPPERVVKCKSEIETALAKYKCSIIAMPSFRLRDDGTWSVVTTVEVVPN